jgi:hypothetical protein
LIVGPAPRWAWLPPIGSVRYYAMLALLGALVLPSPYAFAFGTFFGVITSAWLCAGGVLASTRGALPRHRERSRDDDLPPDMGTVSLGGGGLIVGDALAALGLGLASLLTMLIG